jgi:predicted peptidase
MLFLFFSCAKIPRGEAGKQVHLQHYVEGVSEVSTQYLLYLPQKYGEEDKQWPLLFFLHGRGERGSDINLVKTHGPP